MATLPIKGGRTGNPQQDGYAFWWGGTLSAGVSGYLPIPSLQRTKGAAVGVTPLVGASVKLQAYFGDPAKLGTAEEDADDWYDWGAGEQTGKFQDWIEGPVLAVRFVVTGGDVKVRLFY